LIFRERISNSLKINRSKLLLKLLEIHVTCYIIVLKVKELENWVFKKQILKHQLLFWVNIMDIPLFSNLIEIKQIIILFSTTVILISPYFFITLSSPKGSPSIITFIFRVSFRYNWHHGVCLLLYVRSTSCRDIWWFIL